MKRHLTRRAGCSAAPGADARGDRDRRRLERHGRRQVVRHGHAQRAGLVGLDRQHVRGQVRARAQPRLQGQHHAIAEVPVYQALADGKTDAVLEDWGHVTQQKQYVQQQKTVIAEGPNGVIGVIGWYIPDYLMKQYPAVQDVEGAEGQGDDLQEPRVRLAGHVPRRRSVLPAEGPHADQGARAEPEVRQRRRRGGPGRPLDAALQAAQTGAVLLVRPAVPERDLQARQVKLPPRFKGCQDDESKGGNPAQYACAYPTYILQKFFSTKFATSGSPAVAVLKKWSWSNPDQNVVAGLIAGKHMDPDKAAQKWIAANKAKVNKWLGK